MKKIGGLLKKKSDETVIYQYKYRVQDNPVYGIKAGWAVEVLRVYSERIKIRDEKLLDDIRSMIGQGSLGNFPHYRTFCQNPAEVIDLNSKETSLLAHLSCWNITNNENDLPIAS